MTVLTNLIYTWVLFKWDSRGQSYKLSYATCPLLLFLCCLLSSLFAVAVPGSEEE